MDEELVVQFEQVTDISETSTGEEIQTVEEIILKLDEIQTSIEQVSILLIIIFSFFAGFLIAKSAVEAFFRPWK